MKKRLFAFFVLFVLIVAEVFAGGDKEASSKSNIKELEYFSQKPEAVTVMGKLIAKFEQENPTIKVTLTSTPEPGTVLKTRISTGDMPDVLNTFPAEITYKNIFSDGFCMDLSEQPFMSQVPDGVKQIVAHDGKIYALPITLSVYGIYYRKDIFATYGLSAPTTYEELINVCKTLKANGVTPFSFANKDLGNIAQRTERLLGVINNNVNDEFKKIANGEMNVKDSPTLNAFAKMMLETLEYGPEDSLAVDYESSIADVVNGKAAMTISGTWALGTMRTNNPDIDKDVELIPFPNPVGKTNVPINVDTSYSVSASTKYPDAAMKFLEFLARTDNAQIYADEEKSPNIIKGVQYNVTPHAKMLEYLNRGDIFVTAINFWPTGLREEIRTPVQQLLMDHNIDAFLTSVGKAINKYYNK